MIQNEHLSFESWLIEEIALLQEISRNQIDLKIPFADMNLRGKKLIYLAEKISFKLNRKISPSVFFEFPNIEKLSYYLNQGFNTNSDSYLSSSRINLSEPIAIVGMACRVPGARNLEEFWKNLLNGKDSITESPESRWSLDQYYSPSYSTGKIITRCGGFVDDAMYFDNNLFGISQAEILDMDPQQRILLEVCWEALENYGQSPTSFNDHEVGVFIGIHNNDYMRLNIKPEERISPYVISGGALSMAAGRISYQFGFTGPSIAIDTACSSSLMAIHLACQSLKNDECKMALAGGVNLIFSPDFLIGLSQARMLSPSGRCHTFDASADGYVRAEGCGIIILKRLSEAVAENNNVLAILRGSAVNQDGHSNGITAPNKKAQQRVITRALINAGISAEDVDYIEAHGTGTVLGDLIELEALDQVFNNSQSNNGNKPIYVGSVKTNIGHCETAAGVIGLIKLVLALQNEAIPLNLHYLQPNAHFNWQQSRLKVPTKMVNWPIQMKKKRIAGISSFGFSGTNVHCLIEEGIPSAVSPIESDVRSVHLLMLSAASEESLINQSSRYLNYLKNNSSISLDRFCFTANVTRAQLSYRNKIVFENYDELVEKLTNIIENKKVNKPHQIEHSPQNKKILLCFSENPNLILAKAAILYKTEKVFRIAILECENILVKLQPLYDGCLLKYFEDGFSIENSFENLIDSRFVLFAAVYGLVKVIQLFDIQFDSVYGYGSTKLLALCYAGIITWEEGLRLLISYNQILQKDDNSQQCPYQSRFNKIALSAQSKFKLSKGIELLEFGELDLVSLCDNFLRQPEIKISKQPFVSTAYNLCVQIAPTIYNSNLSKDRNLLTKHLLNYNESPWYSLLEVMAELFVNGFYLNYQRYTLEAHRKNLSIPNYAFDRKKFWNIIERIKTQEIIKICSPEIDRYNSDLYKNKDDLLQYLDLKVTNLLKLSEPLNYTLPLTAYGFDSLMTINLRNLIYADLGVNINVEDIMYNATINSIVETVTESIPKKIIVESTYEENNSLAVNLSLSQLQLWMLQQLDPETAAYNLPIGLKLSGDLDKTILAEAINIIYKQHDILRTNFIIEEEQVKQVVQERRNSIDIQFIDLTQLSTQVAQCEADQIAKDFSAKKLNLAQDSLFQVTLIHIIKEEYLLILLFHHIIMDGWSFLEIFLPNLQQLYSLLKSSQNLHFHPSTMQYIDFVDWQKSTLNKENTNKHLLYWKNKLNEADFQPLIHSDWPRHAITARQGRRKTFYVSSKTYQCLSDFCKKYEVTMFSLLLACIKVLVAKWSGKEDIIIGTSISNRPIEMVKNVIGDFTTHVPLRTKIEQNQSILSLVKNVNRTVMEALQHLDCPFDKIINAVNPERYGNYNPLYNIAFVMHSFAHYQSKWQLTDNLYMEFFSPIAQIDNHTSELDLLIEALPTDNGLIIECEYDTNIFRIDTIDSLINSYQVLLKQISLNLSNILIKNMTIVDNKEKQLLTTNWGRNLIKYSHQLPLHKAFEQQVKKNPTAIAIIFENQKLTYYELEQLANKLANDILKSGAVIADKIGIYTERSIEMIIGIVGVLKAGCAYVPLDPQYPLEQHNYIINDAKINTVVTQKNLPGSFILKNLNIIIIQNKLIEGDTDFKFTTTVNLSVNQLAYVIYTSGSTGKPKGVMVTHYNVLRLFSATNYLYHFTEKDTWTLFHSYAFDFSVWEIWGALLHGAKLLIVPYLISRSPDQFYQFICNYEVTMLSQTPTAFRQLIQTAVVQRKITSLRYVFFGGESLDLQIIKPWIKLYGYQQPHLVNMYGITETTVHTTYRYIDDNQINNDLFQKSIGLPLPDLQVYILDKNHQILPINAIGEICITGAGISQGYLNMPELNANKFLKSDLLSNKDEKLYCSGDLGRYLKNGEIEYFGRQDDQIKIRGFRIGLSEIEASLMELPYVKDCLANIYSVADEDHRIAAYVVIDEKFLENHSRTSEHILGWKQVFNSTYQHKLEISDPKFNTIGWNSSFTGGQIATEQMKEFVDLTVKQIEDLQPNEILEIGCGTGMLLFRLASKCISYWATDLSEETITNLNRQLDGMHNCYHTEIKLFNKQAHDLSEIPTKKFDIVILNSVIQFFPSSDYLEKTLLAAVEVVNKNGKIFIGDVRNYSLFELFQVSVQFYRAESSLSCEAIKNHIFHAMTEEEELLVAPEFFYQLPKKLSRIKQVEIRPKRGYHVNELTSFRYDVLLFLDSVQVEKIPELEIEWPKNQLFDEKFLKAILNKETNSIIIKNIPNVRLFNDYQVLHKLNSSQYKTKENIFEEIKHKKGGVNPEDFFIFAEKNNYYIKVLFDFSNYEFFNVVLSSTKIADVIDQTSSIVEKKEAYTNNPLLLSAKNRIIEMLRQHTIKKLPKQMVPNAYIILDQFPMTNNGKLNRKALPLPHIKNNYKQEKIITDNPVEELLVKIWQSILHNDYIGNQDNFFEIGGNSLLATQMVSRIKDELGIEIALRDIFTLPTIADLSQIIIEQLSLEEVT